MISYCPSIRLARLTCVCLYVCLSSQVLRPGKVKNPIVMVGNYILDTLHQDVFQVQQQQQEEAFLREEMLKCRRKLPPQASFPFLSFRLGFKFWPIPLRLLSGVLPIIIC